MYTIEAVLLAAGWGHNMQELTDKRPKCLLPVGNHCLIWYAITNLKSVGISRIICLVPDKFETEVKQYCNKKFGTSKELSIEFVPVVYDDDCGTAESILSIKDKITRDFIVYSCDSIIHPKSLLSLVNHYRLYDSTLTMLFLDDAKYFQPRQVPGSSEKERIPKDFVAIESIDVDERVLEDGISENKVVFIYSEGHFNSKSKLKIRNRELALHPCIQVYSCFLDSHVYIFKKYVLDFMQEHSDLVLLKSEVIPLIISKQFAFRGEKSSNVEEKVIGLKTIYSDYETELKQKLERFLPRNVVNESDYESIPEAPRRTVCHALVTGSDKFAYRVNTVGSLITCNCNAKNILKEFGQTLNVIKDCPIGENSQVGNKCVFKQSSIGSNCKIGDKVKIFDCIIMDNVEIESNATLSECIVSCGAKIGSKCDLKLCIIGSKQTLAPGVKSKNEVIKDGYSLI